MRLFNRRQFGLSLVGASAAGLLSWQKAMAADPPPETTTIKLKKSLAICFAPYYVVEEFLRAEGFEDIRYIEAKDDAASQSLIQT